jgi:hypothetical protein
MRLKPSTVVGDLLEAHPNAAEVFELYGVEIEDAHHEWTLGEVCDEFNLDPMDLVVDLDLAIEEGEGEAAGDQSKENAGDEKPDGDNPGEWEEDEDEEGDWEEDDSGDDDDDDDDDAEGGDDDGDDDGRDRGDDDMN